MQTKLKYRYRIKYSDGTIIASYFTIEDIENHKGLNKKSLRDAGAEILSRDRYIGYTIHGIEVYEGDFLEGSESGEFGSILSTWIDVVVWDKEKAGFVALDIGEGETLEIDDVMSEKVAGNIYTHPEWLQRIRKKFDMLRGDNQ